MKFCSCLLAGDDARMEVWLRWDCCVKCRRLDSMRCVVCKNRRFSSRYEQLQVVELCLVHVKVCVVFANV
jgi:hypothetical protein